MVAVGKGSRCFLHNHKQFLQQKIQRDREKLIITLAVALSEDDDIEKLKAHRCNKRSKVQCNKRSKVKDMFDQLGKFWCQSYQMTFRSFLVLYGILKII